MTVGICWWNLHFSLRSPMSYVTSEGQKSAQESPSSVEAWVVRAISEGVIDGRIDQLNRKVWQFQRCCWGMRCSLVGGLEHLLFPYIGNNNPNCLYTIFQRGWNHQPDEMLWFWGVQAPFDGGSSASISLVESLIDRNISCLTVHFSRGMFKLGGWKIGAEAVKPPFWWAGV